MINADRYKQTKQSIILETKKKKMKKVDSQKLKGKIRGERGGDEENFQNKQKKQERKKRNNVFGNLENGVMSRGAIVEVCELHLLEANFLVGNP